ncbi:TetR family transcriptional regulator [Streptomyces albireticuli]|uniref:TetR family transcriptional regulator n=2 Tax=Streptomyces albireticuli TaxID=1940 RepID=A0A2A2D5T3_9ACTN|nr:TetR family transcriptional regulator [Streptomyces albireticuli]
METFWRHGYEGTSTRELSKSTGLGPSSLYNTFGDKRRLYLRALRWYYETSTADQIALLRSPGTAKDRLRAMMVQGVDADLAGTGRAGCFAINAAVEMAAADPDVKEEARRNFARVEEELRLVLEVGQRSGEIRSTRDAPSLARQVQSAYYGLRILSRVQDDRKVLLDIVESTLADL